ncbi:MAG: hypothetical protein KAF91_14735 [Nostoc sp. TH1S01]|nr:hypothetical protein [Nostoc sp. TH1S01]
MEILGNLNPDRQEDEIYETYEQFNSSVKIIESNNKKFIFRLPPPDVRPVFSPAPIISTCSIAKKQKEEVREIIKLLNLKERRILQMMGCLNMYIYLIAKDWEAIQQNTKNSEGFKYQINHNRLHEMVAIADRGELENAFPSTYAVEYLSQYWGISCTRRSYWGVREFFRNYLSLFDFEPGIYQTRAIPIYKQINFRRMLLVYEVLEEELNERNKGDLLPEHLGSNVVHIYNAVFLGYFKYRRNWRFDYGAVIHEETMQRPVNKNIKKPRIRRFGNKSWSELTGKVWDSFDNCWIPWFRTKDELDDHLAKQRKE